MADTVLRGHALRGLLVIAWLLPATIGLESAVPRASHADEIRDRQWHLEFLDIARAHKITQGEGVTVAVIDSGVDYRHPDLKDALLPGHNFSEGRRDGWQDPTGHGTAMATLIAGRGHGHQHRDGVLGIAPRTKVLPVRVKSSGPVASPRALEQGIEWAADHGADILSISLTDLERPGLEDAVRYAQQRGALIIAAAGNAAAGDREVMWPARYPGVVAVSGTDPDGNFTAASVSGRQVVLSAPATGIVMAGSGETGRYTVGTGTSGATAIVAGVAALVKARYPELDAANLIHRLTATAEDRGPEGRDPRHGYGIVDPVAALTEPVPRTTADPLVNRAASAGGQSTTGRTGAPSAGIGRGGWMVITVATLSALALMVVAIAGLIQRRRRTTGVRTGPTGVEEPRNGTWR
ncbi:MAG TPA: type VII secretion-associated serine protease mycosin [Micromonosporaceae bacterium]|nr:type VII secretion-associated serine protease mycosin [Micromonosporaceae bacterium]